jgi:hypothetical protein
MNAVFEHQPEISLSPAVLPYNDLLTVKRMLATQSRGNIG